MKLRLLRSLATMIFLFIIASVSAQSRDIPPEWPVPDYSNECLGIHCYVSVDLENDPVINGYLKYTIPTPREVVDFIAGPAGAYLSNNLGSTVDVYVRRNHLELALADQPYAQVPFELFVRLWQDPFGGKTTTPGDTVDQCYYYVVFNMNTL